MQPWLRCGGSRMVKLSGWRQALPPFQTHTCGAHATGDTGEASVWSPCLALLPNPNAVVPAPSMHLGSPANHVLRRIQVSGVMEVPPTTSFQKSPEKSVLCFQGSLVHPPGVFAVGSQHLDPRHSQFLTLFRYSSACTSVGTSTSRSWSHSREHTQLQNASFSQELLEKQDFTQCKSK